jgi:hypothetical protein
MARSDGDAPGSSGVAPAERAPRGKAGLDRRHAAAHEVFLDQV